MNRAFAFILASTVLSCGPGIYNRDMDPAKGTYEAPGGKVGEKPQTTWSGTTYEASVKGNPLPGKVVTLVGEIIDVSCYLQLGKHGAKHRDCAQKCMRNNQPIGLLLEDGEVVLLMEEEHHPRRDAQTNLREKLIEQAAEIVEVTGTRTEVGGQQALYVQGFVAAPKKEGKQP